MGELIDLASRMSRRPTAPPRRAPSFYFDVSCPRSYLAAEQVERLIGDVEWVAVDSTAPSGPVVDEPTLRARCEMRAQALRLPLVWPERFPERTPCALRAAAYACEIGAGVRFALAAGRLAFCGGFDLDNPETLAEAAAAAGIPLDACLEASGESWRDEQLVEAAATLRAEGLGELPAVYLEGRWFSGDVALASTAAPHPPGRRFRSPLAPVG
ncbi:MAG: DsbA family protein [Solirubrobacterales bacterium]|nr:DsbA family protein [Solirubrobacterales bacterium]